MKPAKITTLLVVALVALRLGCGWLFYREGSKKLDSGKFTSQGFLRNAKGPFAGMYLRMVPDIYGAVRLNPEETQQRWDDYYNAAVRHFDFDEPQQEKARLAYDRANAQLHYLMDDIAEQIQKYDKEFDRLQAARADEGTADVEYRAAWIEKKQKELDGQLNGWLADINKIWDSYEHEVNVIASQGLLDVRGQEMSQLDYYHYFPLPRPGEGGLSASFADRFIPWLTFLVGVLLVLGLFTRVAAVAGAAFLLSVIASQPPLVIGASDTNYQIVLLLALLVLAAVGAGRWGGLDFFLGLCCRKCCGSRTTNTPATSITRNEPQQAKST